MWSIDCSADGEWYYLSDDGPAHGNATDRRWFASMADADVAAQELRSLGWMVQIVKNDRRY